MLFGRKDTQDGLARRSTAEGKTVLVLDIESGSVGAALARRNGDGTMTILGEHRAHAPARPHRSAETLAADITRLAGQAIARMSEFAAKLRQAPQRELGDVAHVAVFMAPPWGKPNLATGTPDFLPHMQASLRRELSPYFLVPPQFYTSAGAVTAGLRTIAPYEDKYLLCIVTHEMTELLLINNGAVVGHASMPHGVNLPLRTLRAHGGVSEAEARSALTLGHLGEPLSAAAEAFAGEFFAAGRELFDAYAPTRVWVVSPAGEYFAKALSHPSLGELFPQGGTVSALTPAHALAHVPGTQSRDIFLVLETLFVLYI